MKNENVNSAIETHSTSATTTKQARTLVIFLVVVGYILTFITAAKGTAQFSALQIVIGVLFGVAYIILGMFDTEILQRFPANTRHALYFFIQIALVFGIGWLSYSKSMALTKK